MIRQGSVGCVTVLLVETSPYCLWMEFHGHPLFRTLRALTQPAQVQDLDHSQTYQFDHRFLPYLTSPMYYQAHQIELIS